MTFKRHHAEGGFTLIELMVVILVIAILAGLLLPTLNETKVKSQGASCRNNLKQMQLAWVMYADDYADVLAPNAPSGGQFQAATNFGETLSWCSAATEGWGNQDANTNTSYYTGSVLSPYLGGQIRVYKCPGDIVASANGQRLRSYSMNCQMGQYISSQKGPAFVVNENPGYRVYNMMKDLTCPDPSSAWVFCDEHAGSIDDGFLRLNMTSGLWPDVPASYHDGSCSFSFADGHVELRKWATAQIRVPVVAGMSVHNVEGATTNADYVWFTQRSTCLIGAY